MRILYIYCHPLPESFHAGIRAKALAALKEAGHQVDLLDLYAEKFDPVLSEDARRHYHDDSRNRVGLENYVARLTSAEVLILQFPTWCFGLPAMLKGFFDRMILPGVAFDLSDPAHAKPMLLNLKRIVGIVTYGRPRYMALWMCDPPRRIVKRYVRWFTGGRARADYHALYHLAAVLDRVKVTRRDVVVLHVRLLRRSGSGESDLEANQLFGGIEQYLFSQALALAEKRGKSIKLAVVPSNDLWDAVMRAAVSLKSSTIVLGRSIKLTVPEQAREIGLAWERLPDPRPPFNLEIFLPGGQREFYLLGPHAPHLTANEVNLIHQHWLRFSDQVSPEELHHHDVVHFALNEVDREMAGGGEAEVVRRLREHLQGNREKRQKPQQ